MALTTKLQAVNDVLSVAGDSPVSSLSSGYEQAEIAQRILEEITKEEQSEGLWFNTNFDLELLPNVLGEVELPANALEAFTHEDNGQYIQRGLKFFDLKNNTYVINKSLTANVIVDLDWDLIPETFRRYVIALAKLRYNNEYFGSETVQRNVTAEAQRLYERMREKDTNNKQANVFNNARVHNIAFRNRRR